MEYSKDEPRFGPWVSLDVTSSYPGTEQRAVITVCNGFKIAEIQFELDQTFTVQEVYEILQKTANAL
jgi:hypothetical protein